MQNIAYSKNYFSKSNMRNVVRVSINIFDDVIIRKLRRRKCPGPSSIWMFDTCLGCPLLINFRWSPQFWFFIINHIRSLDLNTVVFGEKKVQVGCVAWKLFKPIPVCEKLMIFQISIFFINITASWVRTVQIKNF